MRKSQNFYKILPSSSSTTPVNGRNEKKNQAENHKKGLKIFFESDNLNSEPRSEWNFKSERKKYPKHASKKFLLEEKIKNSAEQRNNMKRFDSCEIYKNQVAKVSSDVPDIAAVTHETRRTSRSRAAPDLGQTNQDESLKAPVNSLFTIRKENVDPVKQLDPVKALHVSIPAIHKSPEKAECPSSNTQLDFGKKKINDILKMHAQKFQTYLTKSNSQMTDSFEGVSELLDRVHNISNPIKEEKSVGETKDAKPKAGKNEKEINETQVKSVKNEQQTAEMETKKEKQPDATGEEVKPRESRELKEVVVAKGSNDEKKTSQKIPQSNEPQETAPPAGQKVQSSIEKELKNEEEDEKSSPKAQKIQDIAEKDRKTGKKITYTDRLIVLRLTGKEDEKKSESSNENESEGKETNVAVPERLDPLSRIFYLHGDPKSQMCVSSKTTTKDLCNLKDTEHIFKAKSTRSAELRDLVTQAVREHKIFCIFDNHSYIVRPVREELLSRGWLEVIPDRRLIPRRRPPPMGPMIDRDKMNFERNCNTIEAILAAKESFVDEIQESVSKSTSFKSVLEGLNPTSTPGPCKKSSQESVNETLSLFRIIPPNTEKKRNNAEIREFVNKYGALLEKDTGKFREAKLKEMENNAKQSKRGTRKTPPSVSKTQKNVKEESKEEKDAPTMLPKSDSFQKAAAVVAENKKVIDLKNPNVKEENKLALGVLYDSTAKKKEGNSEEESSKMKKQETVENTAKNLYTDSETKTISKMIQSMNARIHFMWLSIKPGIHLKCFSYSPEIINKFQKTTFCTKIGLWSHLNNIQWYAHEVHFPAKSPRMYNTGEADDLQAFFQDFQMTACIGMLKWLSETFFDRGMKAVQTKKGKVPLKAFEFAIRQCEKYVKFKDNEDLSILEEQKILQDEWNSFLQWFYIITNDHGKVQESSSAQLMVVYTKAVETLKLMKRYWPEIDIDGRLNIWIMKPYCASCGRGIFMTNNVYYIGQHSKYIVQKYIEKPLLIYNTKFDIRQWFMITKLTPLEIWMYKECYLRFCTQPFALRNLHESVHLSNNSVQRKYVSVRDSGLPDQNMWDSKTFQLYLRTIGHPNAWDDIIYPGMKDAIISTMLAAQDTFDGPRKSWFEVYGADFMISANVKDGPWLIEINENPAMDPSTKVTARLCPQMLRDVIKVVVDKRTNKNASTGQWELAYRQNYSPSFGSVDLDVRGKKIARVPCTTKTADLTCASILPARISIDGKSNMECETSKLYEIVKSLGTVSNSRGDGGCNSNSCERMLKSFKLRENNSALLPFTAKANLKANLQSLMIMMENRPSIRDKKEETMAHKIISSTVENSRYPTLESKISIKNFNKNRPSVVVSANRLKRMRNNSSNSEPL